MDDMTDQELDRLLGMASKPQAKPDAAAQAAARAFAQDAPSNVVAFTPRTSAQSQPSRIAWLTALPLAASLAAGIYLGALGSGNYLLPESLGGGALTEEAAVLSGVEDMEDLTDEDLS